ncbi:YheC/YheD family protein [Virgibacillus dokdonensis]|uniref:Endospore coat-associated protein YheD n=1 Tax=Virgibacillus dokdonensis TaxID=302167 RepID=A0A2K9IU96_9BACI|nr:YheC/YheD family protein [Virgibacillus dokdonensis]AUJ23326.1 Endospore coat-associated protein YheD [Virgibacillus dokdonensis]
MEAISQKQLSQANNILHTIVEATEYFYQLVKQEESNQAIFIFSSIVEGVQSVSKTFENDEFLRDDKRKLENYLLQVAQLLEANKFIKITEVLQFSFLPLLKRMLSYMEEIDGQNKAEKVYTIGVFSPQANPVKFLPQPRLQALIKESQQQNARLLFFTETDVDLENNEIEADTYVNGSWERITAPFPDVINNIGTIKPSHIERELRRKIPFTSYHVGNKFSLPKRMVKYRKYADLLVPFRLCQKESDIFGFLQENNKVVFKSLLSNRGENIFFVTKKGNRYILMEHKKERILNQDVFSKWLQEHILRKKGSFIIQRYIHTRTKNDEPYHIRSHVQKNGQGDWIITHIYPRVGNRKSNLSNVATEGRVEDFHTFLLHEYGELGEKYAHDILQLSLEVASHLDKLYNFALDELGLDFAIDENGRYWMHEANNGPQTAYHEEKRAVNTIAYAKYLAENGIFRSDRILQQRFNSSIANISNASTNGKPTIGMLVGKHVRDALTKEFAKLAEQKEFYFYVFSPKDVDEYERVIRGYVLEDGEWIAKIIEYPDIVFDRLKMRNSKQMQWLYEELSEKASFTNNWNDLTERSELYNHLADREYMLPFQQVKRTRDIFRMLEAHHQVVLKPEVGTLYDEHVIKELEHGKYLLIHGKRKTVYSQLPLTNKLKELLEERSYVVQVDPRITAFENRDDLVSIHVHLMNKEMKNWDFISGYVKTKSFEAGSNATVHRRDMLEYLTEKYDGQEVKLLESELMAIAENAATTLKNTYQESMSEVAISLSMNDLRNIYVLDVNPSGPSYIYNPTILAKQLLSYISELFTGRG